MRSAEQFHLKGNLVRKIIPTDNRTKKELIKVLLTRKEYVWCQRSRCKKYSIVNPFNLEKSQAGEIGSTISLKETRKYPELESTWMQSVIKFNKTKVKLFFGNLKKAVFHDSGRMRLPPENIFNMDESRYSTIFNLEKLLPKRRKDMQVHFPVQKRERTF